MGIWEMNLGHLIVAGGPIMVPIIICSILALAIVLGKLFYFSSISADTVKLKNDVFDLVKNNQIKEAVKLCNDSPSPVAKILKAGVLKFGCPREEIKEAMEDVSLFEIPKLEKRLTALATIANISPLLGLLGTVTGMTGSFHTIQVRAASMNPVTPGDLAGGIWEALLTTVAGLMVAIPAFVAYNYCVSRVNAFILDMERAATELVNFLCHLSESRSAAIEG
ncbi:MAG: MotA/TolQ/ExbB proton channel family protein [Candidatus Omnitrophota bacterium]|nr:MotA/TolQ/ExbB proton channel family protein [Candidatus Omnitrophota bacterium]MDZ4242087.1 MotA/TolQ/ExbB proton channel family protein [Candidatus Omnitrophota bacterium]